VRPSGEGDEGSLPLQGRSGYTRRRGGSDGGELLRYAVASAHNSPPSLAPSPPLHGVHNPGRSLHKHWGEGPVQAARSDGGSATGVPSSRSSSGSNASLGVGGPLASGDSLAGKEWCTAAHAPAPYVPRSTEVPLPSLAAEGAHRGPAPAKASWRHLMHWDPSSEPASPSSPSSPAARVVPKDPRPRLWAGDSAQGSPRHSPHAPGPTARDPSAAPSGLTLPPRSERAVAAMAALAARRARGACKPSPSAPHRIGAGPWEEAQKEGGGRSKGGDGQPLLESLPQEPRRPHGVPGALPPLATSGFEPAGAHGARGGAWVEGGGLGFPRGSPPCALRHRLRALGTPRAGQRGLTRGGV